MPLTVGGLLALAVGLMTTAVGMDRDRALYPTVTMVVASYYALFAVMGGSTNALVLEVAAGTVFLAAAVAGFRLSLWIAVIALAGHGAFDFVHGRLISNPGMPAFWPTFCGAYDVAAGLYLTLLLKIGRIRSAP